MNRQKPYAAHRILPGFTRTFTGALIILLLPITVSACNNNSGQDELAAQEVISDTVQASADSSGNRDKNAVTPAAFPLTGEDGISFVPAGFEIVMEAEGFLNNDDLLDKAIVLQSKQDRAAARPCLVLFKQPDQTYKLAHTSWKAAGAGYTKDGYPVFNTEDMSIDNGNLNFQMFDAGPSGNLSTIYKYQDQELILVEINTYNMGAGSHTELNLDLLHGEFTQTVTHTMDEKMTAENTAKPYKLPKKTFENADPLEIIHTAYGQVGE